MGGGSANSRSPSGTESAEVPPTPDLESELCSPRTPPRASRARGGEEDVSSGLATASRFATSPPAPFVDARARCAAASPPARRSHELSGGGCRPVPEPMPASPRLIAGLSSSASAGAIGCTSGREALELGAFDFGVLPGFFGASGFFAMAGIWDESGGHERAKAGVRRRQENVEENAEVIAEQGAKTVGRLA